VCIKTVMKNILGSVLVIEKDYEACVYFMQDLDIRPGIITRPDNNIDENEEFQYLRDQSVIDLVYNDSTNDRNYWLTNLKLPPSYEYNDDDEYDDANVCFIRNNYKGLFVACLGRGHRMDDEYIVLTLKCVYCVSNVWKRIC